MVLFKLGETQSELNYDDGPAQALSVEDQFILSIMKLWMHPTNREAAINIKICKSEVGNLFFASIKSIYLAVEGSRLVAKPRNIAVLCF